MYDTDAVHCFQRLMRPTDGACRRFEVHSLVGESRLESCTESMCVPTYQLHISVVNIRRQTAHISSKYLLMYLQLCVPESSTRSSPPAGHPAGCADFRFRVVSLRLSQMMRVKRSDRAAAQ